MSLSRAAGAGAHRALPPGARFRLRVAGTSMEPALRDGDELEVERVAGASGTRLGDLVVVDLPGAGLVVHRLLWRSPVRTWGDGSRRMDPPLRDAELLGTVVSARRAGQDVTPSPLSRRLSWGRQLALAAAHRLRRRLNPFATLRPASRSR